MINKELLAREEPARRLREHIQRKEQQQNASEHPIHKSPEFNQTRQAKQHHKCQ